MSGEKQEPGVFARQSSGLIRTLSSKETFLLNFMYLSPAASIAYPLTFAVFFPGSNWMLATLVGALLALPTAFMYYYIGMLTPRSAGDYVYVSRYLGPRLGMIQALVNIFGYGIGLDVQTEQSLVIVPFFQTLGMVFHDPGLITLGNTLVSNTFYYFVSTTVMILIIGAVLMLSMKWIAKVISSLTILQIIGTFVIIAVLFSVGRAGFAGDFSSISTSFGGPSYSAITSSYKLSLSFNGLGTLLLGIMIMGNLFIYNNAPIWVGGEVKKGSRAIKSGILYSYIFAAALSLVLVFSIVDFIGQRFFIQASDVGWTTSSGAGIPVAPYSLLAFVIIPTLSNLPLVMIILISSLTWFVSYAFIGGLNGTRAMFAVAMDRLLPEKFLDISPTLKSPYFSVLVFFAIALLFNYLEIYQGFSLSLMFGVISYMLFQYFIASLAAFRASKSAGKLSSKLLISSGLSAISVISAIGILLGYGALTYNPSGFGFDLFSGNVVPSILLLVGIVVASLIWFEVARYIRKKNGVDVSTIFKEIPPE